VSGAAAEAAPSTEGARTDQPAPRPAHSPWWQVSLGTAGLVPVGLSVRVLVVVSPVVSAFNSAKVNSAAAAPPPSAAAAAPATPSRPTIATPRYVR
jgi:hypothetical protein